MRTLEVLVYFDNGIQSNVRQYLPMERYEKAMQDIGVMMREAMPERTDLVNVTVFLREPNFTVQKYQLGYIQKNAHNLSLGSKDFTHQQVEELRKQQGEPK